MESSNRKSNIVLSFVPPPPALAGTLARDIKRVAGEGDPLARAVRVLAGNDAASRQAMGAMGLGGAAWKAHHREGTAGDVLAGDALLTRALELAATLPDRRCRAALLTYLTRAFSAREGGARFLLAAVVEIGVTLGRWTLEPEGGEAAEALAEVVRSAGGPLIIPHKMQRPPASVRARRALMLASAELRDWR